MLRVKLIYNTGKEETEVVDNYEELDELIEWIGLYRLKKWIIEEV